MLQRLAQNEINKFRKKIEKIDVNNNGISDIQEIKEALEKVEKDLVPVVVAKLKVEDLEKMLDFMNKQVLDARFSPQELSQLATGLIALASLAPVAAGLVESVGAELSGGK